MKGTDDVAKKVRDTITKETFDQEWKRTIWRLRRKEKVFEGLIYIPEGQRQAQDVR